MSWEYFLSSFILLWPIKMRWRNIPYSIMMRREWWLFMPGCLHDRKTQHRNRLYKCEFQICLECILSKCFVLVWIVWHCAVCIVYNPLPWNKNLTHFVYLINIQFLAHNVLTKSTWRLQFWQYNLPSFALGILSCIGKYPSFVNVPIEMKFSQHQTENKLQC